MSTEKKKGGWVKLLATFIIGGAVGSAIGMTLAPKSGQETRKQIRDQAKKALADIQGWRERR